MHSSNVVLAGLLIAFAASPAPAQASGAWKSARHGFSIKAPSGFKEVPMRAGEEWILVKFLSEKAYAHHDRASGFTTTHKPLLQVIVFPHDAERERVTKEGDTEVREIRHPYRDHDDWFKRNHEGGGWFVHAEQEIEVGGRKALYREIKVEKLTDVPRRVLVMIHKGEGRDLAVEVDVIEEQYDSLKPTLTASLRSLQMFAPDPAAAVAPPAPVGRGLIVWSGNDEEFDKSLAERRKAWRLRVLEEAEKGLPKGWQKEKSGDFLILSHTSPTYKDYIKAQAREIREWLEKTFKDIGQGEVLPTVIRICKDGDEASAFLSGSSESFSWDTGEVVCAGGGWILSDFSRISWALTLQFFDEKNPALWRAMPEWIGTGVMSYVTSGRVSKTKGFVFVPDVYAWQRAKKLQADDRLISVQDLISKPLADLEAGRVEGYQDVSALYDILGRWLLEGPGRKGPTAGVINTYLKHALESLETMDREAWKKVIIDHEQRKEPMTEAEEEAEIKARRKQSKEWEKVHAEERRRIHADIATRAFGSWTPADWQKIDKAFRAYIQSGP